MQTLLRLLRTARRASSHEWLGHSGRSCARLSQRGHAAQSHHHGRLSGEAETVCGPWAGQDHQSVALVQLPVQGLLRVPACRSARASGDPDRRDDARLARIQTLRTFAAGLAGGADRGGDQSARDGGYDLRRSVLLRLRPGSAFRGFRPASVRLVPLPGDRGHHHARQTLEDRPVARPAARQARDGRDGILSHEPASAHRARLAQSARPPHRPLFAGRPA